MSGQRKFEATITSRYSLPEKDIYEQVIDLVKKNGIARSRAQIMLVERGLKHTQNPEPLIKEKVVYKDKIVYRDRPKVDKSTPHIQEHITDEKIGGSDPGQRASGDILTSQNKADPPHTALEEKKSPSDTTRETPTWERWLLGIGIGVIAGLTLWRIKKLPQSLPQSLLPR